MEYVKQGRAWHAFIIPIGKRLEMGGTENFQWKLSPKQMS